MTIRRGESWGVPVERPPDLIVVASDVELARAVAAGTGPLAVSAGDVHRTVGGSADRPAVQRVPLDVLRVEVDGRPHVAVAHVVVRRSWWRGPLFGVLNCGFVGTWQVAPRGHPNDGRAEIVEVDAAMTLRARLQAWRRLPLGTHVPHPRITVTSRADANRRFDPPRPVYVDGRRVGTVSDLRVTVDPDAYVLHV